jgi:hypothetical protein
MILYILTFKFVDSRQEDRRQLNILMDIINKIFYKWKGTLIKMCHTLSSDLLMFLDATCT